LSKTGQISAISGQLQPFLALTAHSFSALFAATRISIQAAGCLHKSQWGFRNEQE
jgi:hypothetical protein